MQQRIGSFSSYLATSGSRISTSKLTRWKKDANNGVSANGMAKWVAVGLDQTVVEGAVVDAGT